MTAAQGMRAGCSAAQIDLGPTLRVTLTGVLKTPAEPFHGCVESCCSMGACLQEASNLRGLSSTHRSQPQQGHKSCNT